MIKNLLTDEQPGHELNTSPAPSAPADGVLGLFDSGGMASNEPQVTQGEPSSEPIRPFEPESPAETMRRSGLAYSAGIAFAAAVIFMLILGWGADVLLGTSPWGIVGGIILGSIIGFVQFFRLTSQIFKK